MSRVVSTTVVLVALIVGACTSAPPPSATPAATPTGGATATAGATAAPAGAILAQVRANDTVRCGVNTNLPGFGFPEEGTGRWLGFDADFCRVVAAAVLGDPEKVTFRPLSADDRGPALQAGEIDALIRNTTWTLTRDAEWGLFAATTFYDGQGMMVPADSGVTELADLEGATICVQSGTTTELTLPDQMRALGVNYTQDTRPDIDQTYATYEAGDCDAVTSDRSQLVARRTLFATPDDHLLLDAVMSKEPLGPAVPFGDERWFNVVKWATWVPMQAEEVGVNQGNVDQIRSETTDPVVRRLLGVEGELGAKLGLSNDWAYNVISAVGNYADIYDRHLGPNTPFDLDRGLNNLWTNGGLLYPPAWR